MPEFFGRVGGTAEPIPSFYNQSLLLETSFRGKVIAQGKLTSAGFHLMKGSLVKKHDTFRDNHGIRKTRDELIAKQWLSNNGQNSDYFILQNDILLASSSTAARLVHGNGRDGLTTWMHNRAQLRDLLREE
jgi:hypothetical protein